MYIRIGIFIALVLVASQALVIAVIGSLEPGRFFKEDGTLEWVQFSLISLSGIVLVARARTSVRYPTALQLLGLVALLAGVRELDRFFDHLVFENAYKPVAGWILVVFAYVAFTQRAMLGEQLRSFSRTPPFFWMIAGSLVVVVYAQLVGQHELWQAILGDSSARVAKRAVEEMSETLGYAFILFGSIEALFLEPARESVPTLRPVVSQFPDEPVAELPAVVAYNESGPRAGDTASR